MRLILRTLRAVFGNWSSSPRTLLHETVVAANCFVVIQEASD
jgi:hypothetical protein